ncbi:MULTISPECIES: MFS transporter [Paraburkholderia]|uniref:Sugar phosphate permease n=1 Tax=Paraburkholderia tropica TaxID=92647 RepID=A0A1A5XIV9_9BURK|nr:MULTISPECIES: MFS transporter [Paraburkholderia]MBB2979919.1 sugar phosphate permease [Paraburkholderia tropica]MBB3000478.1 sugar phosphate permease [Paraburkholderia tropica]MBB6320107.1 sugar phosphate permease [Paraburkholderia tropica]MBN3813908.1 MFS transporter [Paraburkholderia sp. Ac-20347]MDE1144971.1 MFS transporter [Paraburkholderia tropica]
MPTKSPRLKRIQTVAVAFLTVAGIVNYLDRSTLSIANHSVAQELHLNASEMGLLLSAFSLAYAFAQLPVGALLDRFGSRVMLGLGMLVWSVAQVTGGFIQTLNHFLIARVVLGVAEAPLFPAGAKVIHEWFAVRERGGPTGTFISSSTIAPMIAPPLLTVLMLSFGWRPMFVIMGVLGVLVSIGWYAVYRNRDQVALSADETAWLEDGAKEPPRAKGISFAEWGMLLKLRNTWGMIFGFMGVIYMVWLYLTWLPGYLEKERHLSIAHTGWLVAIPYVFGTIGMAGSGFIADYLLKRGVAPIRSRKWPVCVGLIGAAAFTVPAAYTPSTALAITYVSLAMFFVNLASGSAWALVSIAAPRHLVASLGSMQNFGGYLGGSFAPVITGIVVDQTHSFVNALLISAAIAFAAAFVYLFVVKEVKPDDATHAAAAQTT